MGIDSPLPPVVWQRLLSILLANGVLGLFVVAGSIQPLYLVLLVALEALCLTALEAVEVRLVPARDVDAELRRGLLQRFSFIGVCMAGLLFINGMILFAMFDGQAVRELLRRPLASLAASNIAWPLAVTLALALVDTARDLRRHALLAGTGGPFESTPGRNAQARWMTLVFSALPHAIPLFSLVVVATTYLRRRNARTNGGEPPPIPQTAIAAMLVLVGAVLFFISWMLSSGVTGWTVAFCVGKVFSEGLIQAVPLVGPARVAARDGGAVSRAQGGKPGRRARRRLRQGLAGLARTGVAERQGGE